MNELIKSQAKKLAENLRKKLTEHLNTIGEGGAKIVEDVIDRECKRFEKDYVRIELSKISSRKRKAEKHRQTTDLFE